MGVRVQRLDRAGVAETGLHRFHALPVPDQQTCIVIAQRVKPGPGRKPLIELAKRGTLRSRGGLVQPALIPGYTA